MKALGLFRLYDCLKIEKKKGLLAITKNKFKSNKNQKNLPSQKELKLFKNEIVYKFLREESLNQFDLSYR